MLLLSQHGPWPWTPPEGSQPHRTSMRMSWGLLGSAVLHILVALLLIYGRPTPSPPPDFDQAIPVDLVQAGAPTASPPLPKRGPTPLSAPAAVPEAQPAPQAEAPPPAAAEPARPDEGRKINPLAEIVPEKKPPAPAYGAGTRLAATPKPRLPAPAPPAAESQSAGLPSDTVELGNDPHARGPATYDVKDALRAEIERRWNFDVDALGGANVTVSIHLTLEPDGTVDTAEIVADPEHADDPVYRQLAISARDAVLVSSPLHLPPGAYAGHADMVLKFSPHDVLR